MRSSSEHSLLSLRLPSPALETTCSMVILRTSSRSLFQNFNRGITFSATRKEGEFPRSLQLPDTPDGSESPNSNARPPAMLNRDDLIGWRVGCLSRIPNARSICREKPDVEL